ncbi:MAG: ATP-binding protein [Candidatus Dadabacteria bacterium]|nr:MAG: ATP-binding protein [Candidatus Dadabacteria bacterium]
MFISRDLSNLILSGVKNRPVVILTGTRQAGKTTLLQHLFHNWRFVTLDLPSEAEEAEKDPTSFLKRHSTPLIIDEIQYAPALFRNIKLFVDKNRTVNGQYILTGSQKFQLMESVSESLAGRAEILELEPLSYLEVARVNSRITVEELLLRGGYPELHANPEISSERFYRSYIASYLERDVRAITNVSNLRDFERFMRACALRSGQLLNKAELARDVGISPSTANEWLGVLEASGQIHLLEPWFSNKTKSLVKSPKLYLSDTGILLTLLNIWDINSLVRSPMIGAIWETFVFSELRRILKNSTGAAQIFFWNNRRKEVDFVIDTGGFLSLFEAKWSEHPELSDSNTLRSLIKSIGSQNIQSAQIVCRTPNIYPLADGIVACPVSELSFRLKFRLNKEN